MTTTLLAAEVLLSQEIGDYWASTTTADGTIGGTTLVDAALKAKANDWITNEAYDMVTSGAYDGEERKISSLASSTGTLTILAHGGQILSGVSYRVHRLFEASEKRRALIAAAKNIFPFCFKKVRDETLTGGNWLRDGDLEHNWTSDTVNTYWKKSNLTMTKWTTAPNYFRGSISCRLTGATGHLYQSNAENPDLMDLAGKAITFSCRASCDVANSLRLAIYDGITTTYSDYHAGDGKPATLTVSATIADSPSEVSFRVYYTTGATAYVDDLRVYGATRDKLYLGDLGLAQNYPHSVLQSSDTSINREPWDLLRDYEIGSDGYIYIPTVSQNYRLRILGIGYLDFLLSGVRSTDWAATIALDEPQIKILIAQAALYLYTWMSMPNYSAGIRTDYQQMLTFWKQEVAERKAKFRMRTPPATVHWGMY